MADLRIFREMIPDEEIVEKDGRTFYFTEDAIESLQRWIFLEMANDEEISESLKNIAQSLSLNFNKSEQKNCVINSHIVRVKIDIGEKALSLKADVKYIGANWTTFIDEFMTAKEARTLSNYMRIAQAKVDPKHHHLGIHRILTLLKIVKKRKGVNFNEFMEAEIASGDIDIVMDDDELTRHLDKRLNYYEVSKQLQAKNITLTKAEDEELKKAIDNNYKPTAKDISEVASLKNSNSNVVDFFEDKKLSPLPAKASNKLNTETELANFREEVTRVVSLLEILESKDILNVEKELREDLVLLMNNVANLLEPQEDEQALSSTPEEG